MNAKDVKSGGVQPLINWRRAFLDTSTLVLTAIMIAAGAAVYVFKGPQVFADTVVHEILLLFAFTPKMMLAFFVAALVSALVSRQVIARWLGDKAGFRGVALASGIGAVTPGGPMISFPLVTALQDAGSSRPSMIAYLTSWTTLGFQRIMIWELPLLGIDYALIRLVASLPLPFLAALISMQLPVTDREKQRLARARQEEDGQALKASEEKAGAP
ncbi:MAG: permease [Hyphomicrobiales bacterium]|nr:permease [Hyphomicrobiales bacterium]